MSTDERRDYLVHRAAQERAAAERAACTHTRGIHLDLASRYAERLADLDRERRGVQTRIGIRT